MQLDEQQQHAVDLLLYSPIGIITGPPGSGKTTVLREALESLPAGVHVICCAPTGKAAKRIMEVTGFPAGTVHRILGAGKGEGGKWNFMHGPNNPLPYDLVVVDEASMLSSLVAAALMGAINPMRTRVIFVGDPDQLPSVGPGHVFADMIDSEMVPMTRLENVYRAAGESWVCDNAPKILRGDIDLKPRSDFKYFKRLDPDALRKQVVELVTRKLPAAGVTDALVLSPQNGGEIGVERFNTEIQTVLNPIRRDHNGDPEKWWTVTTSRGHEYSLRARDQVIATQNDRNTALFNGETGVIESVTDELMVVDFGGRLVELERQEADHLRLGYCLTVHRSQGSEYDWVVVICHSRHDYMWSRQLLYTAVTRAKKGVILVGDDAGIRVALNNNEPRTRITALYPLLTAE